MIAGIAVIGKPKILPRICADERGSKARAFTAEDAEENRERGIGIGPGTQEAQEPINFQIVSDDMHSQDPAQSPIGENTAKQNATRKFSKEEIIAAIKERAAELGRAPKRAELMRIYPVSPSGIDRQFGSYRNALSECGLEREGCGVPVSLDNLFHDWAQIVRDMKKVPTVMEYGQRSSYSHSTLRQRYGSWNLVPAGMVQYLRERSLEQEWADVLEIGEAFCRRSREKGCDQDRRQRPLPKRKS